MDALVDVLLRLPSTVTFFIDVNNKLDLSTKEYNGKKVNYCNSDYQKLMEQLLDIQKNPNNQRFKLVYVFYGIEKLKSKVEVKLIEDLFEEIRNSENGRLIIADSSRNLKAIELEPWYSKVKNNTDGIWVGKGLTEQQSFRISKITKDMQLNYTNNYGYCMVESDAILVKLIESSTIERDDENEE